MDNLVELLKDAVGEDVVKQLGGMLGESPEKTQKAIDSGVPAILGGLVKQASTPEGSESLYQGLDDYDDGLLEKLDDLLGDAGTSDREAMVQRGPSLLEGIFGGNLQSIVEVISKASGIDAQKITSLLSMLVPIVMGLLNRLRKQGGLDIAGLVQLIMGQQGFLKELLPQGMGDLLGMGNLTSAVSGLVQQGGDSAKVVSKATAATISDSATVVKQVADTAGSFAANSAGDGKSLLGKSLPVLVIIALALAAAKYFQIQNAENPKPRPMVEEVLPANPDVPDATGESTDEESTAETEEGLESSEG